MIGGQRVVAVVPARGGSKTIPRKNVRALGGKPLLAWPIDVAKSVPEIDRVLVSTDDAEIAAVGRASGAEIYMRPPHLATDEALVIDALRDLAERLHAEGETAAVMVLLEATCPLRSAADVRACLSLMAERDLDSVATFKAAEVNPHRTWSIRDGAPEVFIPGAVPWRRRQDLPPAFQLNGAVYAFRIACLAPDSPSLLVGRAGAVVMPKIRSLDIDDELDFELAELVVQRGLHVKDAD